MTTSNPIDRPKYRAYLVFDTANSIVGEDADTSVIINDPTAVQVEIDGAATTVQLYQKVHADAAWAAVGDPIAPADSPSITVFDHEINFVKAVRTGAAEVKVWTQES